MDAAAVSWPPALSPRPKPPSRTCEPKLARLSRNAAEPVYAGHHSAQFLDACLRVSAGHDMLRDVCYLSAARRFIATIGCYVPEHCYTPGVGPQPLEPHNPAADNDVVKRIFIGREAHIEAFRSQIVRGTSPYPLWNVHGAGGSGKTRLLRRFEDVCVAAGVPHATLQFRLSASDHVRVDDFEGLLLRTALQLGLPTPRYALASVAKGKIGSFLSKDPIDRFLKSTEGKAFAQELGRCTAKQVADRLPQWLVAARAI